MYEVASFLKELIWAGISAPTVVEVLESLRDLVVDVARVTLLLDNGVEELVEVDAIRLRNAVVLHELLGVLPRNGEAQCFQGFLDVWDSQVAV